MKRDRKWRQRKKRRLSPDSGPLFCHCLIVVQMDPTGALLATCREMQTSTPPICWWSRRYEVDDSHSCVWCMIQKPHVAQRLKIKKKKLWAGTILWIHYLSSCLYVWVCWLCWFYVIIASKSYYICSACMCIERKNVDGKLGAATNDHFWGNYRISRTADRAAILLIIATLQKVLAADLHVFTH